MMFRRKQYFVVDVDDDFVLYEGTFRECCRVVDEQYGGLFIFRHRDLTPGMVASLHSLNYTQQHP